MQIRSVLSLPLACLAWLTSGSIPAQDGDATRFPEITEAIRLSREALQRNELDQARRYVVSARKRLCALDDGQRRAAYEQWIQLGGTAWSVADWTTAALVYDTLAPMYRESNFAYSQDCRVFHASALAQDGKLRESRKVIEATIQDYGDRSDLLDGLQRARASYAVTLNRLGYLRQAAEVQEAILHYVEKRDAALGEKSLDLQRARLDLANTLHDIDQAREEPLRLRENATQAIREHILPNAPEADKDDLYRVYYPACAELATSWFGRRENLDGAYRLCDGALREMERKGWPEHDPAVMFVRKTLGDLARMKGDLALSRSLLEKDVELREKGAPNDKLLQISRNSLGLTCFFQGDYPTSRALHQKALDVVVGTVDDFDPFLQDVRENLACTMMTTGDPEGAIRILRKVVDTYRQIRHPYRRTALGSLGAAMRRAGHLKEAAGLFKEAFEGTAELTGLNDLWLNYDNVSFFRLNYLLTLAALGPQHRADLIRLMEETVDRAGYAFEKIGSYASREVDANALSIAKSLDVVWSLTHGMDDAVRLRLRRDMFQLRETMRSLTVFARARMHRARHEMSKWKAQDREVSRRIGELRGPARSPEDRARDLAAAVRERDDLDNALRNSPWFATMPPAVRIDRLQTGMDRDAVAVAFRKISRWTLPDQKHRHLARSEEVFVAEIVPRHGALQTVELGPAKQVRDAVSAWHRAVRGGSRAEIRARGKELHALVLAEVMSRAGMAKVFHVCLEDALQILPLEVLPRSDDRHVGDVAEFRYHVSFDHLLRRPPPRQNDTARSMTVIGDIAYGARGKEAGILERHWSALDGTKGEIDWIRQALTRERPGEKLRWLTGTEASKDAVLSTLPGSRFLHLATHCYLEQGRVRETAMGGDVAPLDALSRTRFSLAPLTMTGIVLSNANQDPVTGVLSADELVETDLTGCELAVLSRCDVPPEAHSAVQRLALLQRGLHAAGAGALLISLWVCDDEHAAELVRQFYTGFLAGQNPHRALWNARKAAIAKNQPARSWAGWILTGQ